MKKSITIRAFSSGGVIYHEGKVLTLYHRVKKTIEFPKGGIEPGETKEEACLREVYEETGYKTQIIQRLKPSTFEFDHGDDKKHYKKTVYNYLLEIIDLNKEPTPQRLPTEQYDNLWLTTDDALTKLTYDNAVVTLQEVLEHIR